MGKEEYGSIYFWPPNAYEVYYMYEILWQEQGTEPGHHLTFGC